MKKELAVLGLLFIGFVAWGHSGSPSPTIWSSGQVLTYTALNNTIAHIHNTFDEGITNAMISGTASIEHTKLQVPALIPKAWAYVASTCSASPCTLAASSTVTSIARTGAGVYTVTLAFTPQNAAFAPNATSMTAALYCAATGPATAAPHFTVRCYDATGAAADAGFNFTVMDND